MGEEVTEDTCTGGLIRAILRNGSRNDDENEEEDTERSDTEDDGCNGGINLQKVSGERTAEKQQRRLQHQRQRLHHIVKIPCNDPVQFSLSVLATFDRGPSHLGRLIAVQPLLAEHCQEGGEERSGETGEQNGLDLNYRLGGPGPLRKSGRVVSERRVVNLVDEDSEEGGSLVACVGLQLGVDLDDERGGDSREQTSLMLQFSRRSSNASHGTHEDQGGIQILIIFLQELLIVLLGLFAVFLVELSPIVLMRNYRTFFLTAQTSQQNLGRARNNITRMSAIERPVLHFHSFSALLHLQKRSYD